MTAISDNATLDRLFQHMAWANAQLLEALADADPAHLQLAQPGGDWQVAQIVQHLVQAAGGYGARLTGAEWPSGIELPTTSADLRELAAKCAEFDARLRTAAAEPESISEYVRDGRTVRRARSTILAQAVHHATEHRAQIADVLSAHGHKVIDLDALDLWSFGSEVGEGPDWIPVEME